MKRLCAVLLVLPSLALAQAPAGDDPRYRTLRYDGRTLYSLPTSPDTNQTVLFADGERIKSVRLSDPTAYYVTVEGSGDSIALKAVSASSIALMSVETDRRGYELELTAGRDGPAPQIVRFAYGPPAEVESSQRSEPRPLENVSYRLSGERTLRPAAIHDDGAKTYIAWEEHQAMPAVFGIGPSGDEQMVDGYVRAGVFTIDRIYDELVFKIDKHSAIARRMIGKERN